jgi:3-hydroxyisobutyrate dehydrogenase-like beta-hydroxyacid dehydrogenase
MGSALAKALVAKGYEVTVWNRSHEKAAEFAGLAQVADSVFDAFSASSVIVVCVLNYEASDSLIRSPEIESALSGKVLIQLSTGSPADARRMSAWARACGAEQPRSITRHSSCRLAARWCCSTPWRCAQPNRFPSRTSSV